MAKFDMNKALQDKQAEVSNKGDIDKAYLDMFGLGDDGAYGKGTREIPLDRISFHPLDPFRLYTEIELARLTDSIAKVGLIEPVTVRPEPNHKGYYQMLSGRHRKMAYERNGAKTIPANIKDVDDDIAILILIETNLRKRENILPSERAKAYLMQHDAIKRQGARNDLHIDHRTSTHSAWMYKEGMESAEIVALMNGVKKDEIRRYIRLTYLIQPLLDAVDQSKVNFIAGVNISYLDTQAQETVYNFVNQSNKFIKITKKQSECIRQNFNDNSRITEEYLQSLFADTPKPDSTVKLSFKRSNFKGIVLPSDKELEKLFAEFLKERFSVSQT